MTEEPQRLTPAQTSEIRARQRARSKVLGIILGALAVLFFAITIVKIGLQSSGKM